ncbi:DUF3995 domain-containing protein [Streptosporangium longisporum]|uniref:DUF3995 domain-containing protein n=1 Tax=Streptosporangium longisporum TaxID=46187 RepID=UPI0031F016AB
MNLRLNDTRHRARWPGLAAAVWGFVFAVPSFYWAMGGMGGVESTISPQLVELARRQDPGLIAVVWATGVLKVVGGVLGLALVRRRPWGRTANCLLQLMAWGAGVLLAWHGALFVVQGLLVQAGLIEVNPESVPVLRWYTYLWGPWFVAGGVAFMLAARAHLGTVADRRYPRMAGVAGGLGALVLSVVALVTGIG